MAQSRQFNWASAPKNVAFPLEIRYKIVIIYTKITQLWCWDKAISCYFDSKDSAMSEYIDLVFIVLLHHKPLKRLLKNTLTNRSNN